MRALHTGAAPAVATGAGLTTARAYQINPEAAVTGRWVFIKKRPGGSATVIWHPRAQISSNGTVGGDANSEVLNFIATVQSFPYTPSPAFAGMASAINEYGAQFEVTTPEELETLLDALNTEATAA